VTEVISSGETIDLRDSSDSEQAELITVVIPCRNEEDFIETCLHSVQNQIYRNLEILVIDGGSDDRTAELVSNRMKDDNRIRLLDNPERIVSPGLNRGLAAAHGTWMIRVDAHCTIGSDYIRQIVRHLSTGRYGGVGGRKIGVGRTASGHAIAAAMTSPIGVGNSTYHHGRRVQEVEHVPFGAYPTALARNVGGWDETVVVNQDYEFDHRVRATGLPILFDPEIVIEWHCRQSLPDLFRQYRRYGQGKSVVTRMHPESVKPRHLIPPLFVLGLATLALPSRVLPWISGARATAAGSYVAALVAGAALVESTKPDRPLRPSERLRVVPAFMAMHLGQGLGFWRGLSTSPRITPKSLFVRSDRSERIDSDIDLRVASKETTLTPNNSR
jgi:succinoglycan biosynthesis protein ExoA